MKDEAPPCRRNLIDAFDEDGSIKTQLNLLKTSSLLNLSFYKVGNAIWKDTCLSSFITKDESQVLRNRVQTVLARTDRIQSDLSHFQDIFDISESEKLSFYDSSYLFFAKDKGLILVTEDKRLAEKAKKHMQVENTVSLLSIKQSQE